MNLLRRTTELTMHIVSAYLKEGDVAVDCTCGNGNDTLRLAQLVGQRGKVYGFDIQNEAIENTGRLLEENHLRDVVTLLEQSHEKIDQYVEERPKAIVFNLGYLPKGNKNITTTPEQTIVAIDKALGILKVDGVIAITMYSGHFQGAEEKRKILNLASALDKSVFQCGFMEMINQPNDPPETLFITRKK